MFPFGTENTSLIEVKLCAYNFQLILYAQGILKIWLYIRNTFKLYKKTF